MNEAARRYAAEFIAAYQPPSGGPPIMRVLHEIAVDHPARLPGGAEAEAILRFSHNETWTKDPKLESVVRRHLIEEGLITGRLPKKAARRRQPRGGVRRHTCSFTAWVSSADGNWISRRCLDPGCAVLHSKPRTPLQPRDEGCHAEPSFAHQDAAG